MKLFDIHLIFRLPHEGNIRFAQNKKKLCDHAYFITKIAQNLFLLNSKSGHCLKK